MRRTFHRACHPKHGLHNLPPYFVRCIHKPAIAIALWHVLSRQVLVGFYVLPVFTCNMDSSPVQRLKSDYLPCSRVLPTVANIHVSWQSNAIHLSRLEPQFCLSQSDLGLSQYPL